jgi:DNA-binding response OmpR family regulator
MRVALLEDDSDQAQLMALWLEAAGHDCQTFGLARDFMRALARESFDILIIDWMLPDINGDEVVSWVRQNLDWPVPVLFVTQRDSEQDVVRALELGADDYMAKPAKRFELVARVNALGRRAQHARIDEGTLQFGSYEMDLSTHTLRRGGEEVELTNKEFDLALFLFRNNGRVLSRGHILESVWGSTSELNTRTVDTHISRLRRKLDLSEINGWRLRAVYQHGYRLEPVDRDSREPESVAG